MVDFQSRDTSRGYDDEEDVPEEGADQEASAETESDGTETATEPEETTVPEEMSYAVVTVETGGGDPGEVVVAALEGAGETVATREALDPAFDTVQAAVDGLVERDDVGAVVTVGGVGVGPADVTADAVEPLFDKELPGFGELYRVLSHEQEGTAVVRSRITAGVVGAVPVFCLPADSAGARRGVEQLVLPEAETIAEQASGIETAE